MFQTGRGDIRRDWVWKDDPSPAIFDRRLDQKKDGRSDQHYNDSTEEVYLIIEVLCILISVRLPAMAVGDRIAQEFDCPLGEFVGYQIQMDNRTSKYTHLTVCTTGILLQSAIIIFIIIIFLIIFVQTITRSSVGGCYTCYC